MHRQVSKSARGGFTLVELLVVVVLVMFGVGLLLPMVGRMKGRGSVVQCLNNARQLVYTALLYAEDNSELWPANGLSDPALNLPPPSYAPRLWIEGREPSNITSQEQADAMVSEKFSLLARYVPDKRIFVCPVDRAPIVVRGTIIRRTRSFGMNQFVGWTPDIITPVTHHGEPNRPQSRRIFLFSARSILTAFVTPRLGRILDGTVQVSRPDRTYRFMCRRIITGATLFSRWQMGTRKFGAGDSRGLMIRMSQASRCMKAMPIGTITKHRCRA
jgi:type II secretory pathway pseudopilin PulG